MAEKAGKTSPVVDKARRDGCKEPLAFRTREQLVSEQTEDDQTSTSCLEKALKEHQRFNSRLSELHGKTSALLSKIQTKLGIGDDEIEISFPIAEMEEVERALKKTPAVIFTGNRNSGKSSLLNEVLQGTYLPVHETPCTSRIVRVKYSDENVASVVSPDGRVLQTKGGFKKGIPKDFVVLADEEKDDKEKLGTVVEVGLKHELLRSGIELIDCPGKNETPALDGVVNAFLEKGTAPLVVYVIDGDMHLRPTDHDTILFLREKLPHVAFIFVCNKIDTTEEAKVFDDQDSDSESDDDSPDAAVPQAPDKRETVFAQLLRLYLLPEDADINSCQIFHGISARNVRTARMLQREDEATKNFSRFQDCFLAVLADGIKRHVRLAIDGVASVLDQFILAIQKPRDELSGVFQTLTEVLDVAVKTEGKIADIMKEKVGKNLLDEEVVAAALNKVKHETVQDAETYQRESHVDLPEEMEKLVAVLSTGKMAKTELRDKIKFLFVMVVTVGGKVAVILQSVLEKTLTSVISACTTDLELAIESIEAPSLKRALCRAYGMDLISANGEVGDVAEMARTCLFIPTVMLRSIKGAVSSALSKEANRVFHKQFDAELVGILISRGNHAMDNKWKENVVDSAMSNFIPQQITRLVNETCMEKIFTMQYRFTCTLRSTLALIEVVESLKADQHTLDELRVLFFPQLMQLAVEAFSLKNELDLGAVQLGEQPVASGNTTKIHSFYSAAWPANSVVRVVKEAEVSEELWSRLLEDLYLLKEFSDKQTTPSLYLLRVYGWLMPSPGVLHIVVEAAKTDLLSALQQGMTINERLHVARQVGQGLKFIHDAGYICGDLKPQNILISRPGIAQINLAKPMDPFHRTRLGVPFHLAPDVYKDEGKYGGRVSNDIYAFGMLLWVLCDGTGRARPKAYEDYVKKAQMRIAVEQGIIPERPQESSDACWEVMKDCWKNCRKIKMDVVIPQLIASMSWET